MRLCGILSIFVARLMWDDSRLRFLARFSVWSDTIIQGSYGLQDFVWSYVWSCVRLFALGTTKFFMKLNHLCNKLVIKNGVLNQLKILQKSYDKTWCKTIRDYDFRKIFHLIRYDHTRFGYKILYDLMWRLFALGRSKIQRTRSDKSHRRSCKNL